MAILLAATLIVAACGDDDTSSDASPATTQAAAESETASSTAPDSSPATTEAASESETASSTAPDSSSSPEALLPDRDTLSFGALWETPPMIGVEPADTSTPVGVAPDLAAAMAPLLGVNVEWQNMQWPAQLPGVQSGVVDVLFGQVTITEERELSIVDLIPFYKTTLSLLLPAGNPEGLTRLADACGLSIGVPVGSIQSDLVAKINETACVPNGEDPIVPAEYQGASAAISALRAGTIDGWLNAYGENKAAADETGLALVTLPEDEYAGDYTGLAVSKQQPEVSIALVEALKQLISDGTYGDIMDKWGLGANTVTADEVVINPITQTEVGVVAG